MEKTGSVSVWVGNADSEETLSEVTESSMTEDGDFVACPFCKAIGIERYEPERLEWKFFPKQIERIRILFRAFSYSDIIIPQLECLIDHAYANCCVALYDHQFDGDQTTFEVGNAHFRFLGCTTYHEE
jgi:hypothetical protein